MMGLEAKLGLALCNKRLRIKSLISQFCVEQVSNMAIKEEVSIPFESNVDKEFGNDISEERFQSRHPLQISSTFAEFIGNLGG